jgi:hypothetical protein
VAIFGLALAACTGTIGDGQRDREPNAPNQAGGRPNPPTEVDDRPTLGGTKPLACDPAGEHAPPLARAWRLTRTQYDNTVADLLGDDTRPAASFLPEPGVNGFSNNAFALRVRDQDAGIFRSAAQALAAATVEKRLSKVFPCDAARLTDATCAGTFVTSFGKRAFRRPLSGEELTRYRALYDLAALREPRLGPQAVIEAMLQSPHFLYRTEVGSEIKSGGASGGRARLDAYELASMLSYTLLDSMPDAQLFQAADDGRLATTADIERQVRRLWLERPARPALAAFFLQLAEYEALEARDKDPGVFPGFEMLKPDLRQETDLFVQDVLFEAGATLPTLLTAEYSFMNAAVAKVYGATVAGSAFLKTPTEKGRRAGLLTQPGLLAVLAKDVRTSPVDRGRFVRERLLCEVLEEPPAGVDLSVAPAPPGETGRQQLLRLTAAPQCRGCHGLLNPLGFGFEAFDAIGQWRADDNGSPIDDTGEWTAARSGNQVFRGVPELAGLLSASDQVHECFALQQFRYVFGRAETAADTCAVKGALDRFKAADLDLRELLVALLTSDAALFRNQF